MAATLTANPVEALLKNKKLRNPAFWKKIQQLVHLLIGLVPMLVILFPSYKDVLDITLLSQVEVSLGLVAAYLTTATTDTLGLGK